MVSDKMEGTRAGGQGLVEFVIVMPFLVLLLFGALDLGRAFHAAISLTNSAREGARYGTIYPDATDAEILAAVLAEAENSGIDLSTTTATRACYYGGVEVQTLPAGKACESLSPIRVTVVYNYQSVLGKLFSMETIAISRGAEMLVP